MNLTLGLAQVYRPEDASILDVAGDFFQQAASENVDLLVFPEFLMMPLEGTPEAFRAAAQPLDGPFVHAMAKMAAGHSIWTIFTMNQRNDSAPDAKPLNTAVVLDANGAIRGTYSKNHLFDLNPLKESDYMAPGTELLAPIEAPFGSFSIGICYDLRFPEIATQAAQQGCELMLYPAGWADGPTKADQWCALLAERARETRMHVAGVSLAGPGYVGQSCVFGPQGDLLATAGSSHELLVCQIG